MLYVRVAQQRLRGDERMDWRCPAEPFHTTRLGLDILPTFKDDFGYSTTRKFVVEDVVNSGQKMAEEALFLVK